MCQGAAAMAKKKDAKSGAAAGASAGSIGMDEDDDMFSGFPGGDNANNAGGKTDDDADKNDVRVPATRCPPFVGSCPVVWVVLASLDVTCVRP